MKRVCIVSLALLAGCSSSSPTNPAAEGGVPDGTTGDANGSDGPVADSPGSDGSDAADSGGESTDAADSGDANASDGGDGGAGDGAPDVVTSDGSCPVPALPSDDPFTIDASTTVILHASGAGTQNYTCEATAVDAARTTYGRSWVRKLP